MHRTFVADPTASLFSLPFSLFPFPSSLFSPSQKNPNLSVRKGWGGMILYYDIGLISKGFSIAFVIASATAACAAVSMSKFISL